MKSFDDLPIVRSAGASSLIYRIQAGKKFGP